MQNIGCSVVCVCMCVGHTTTSSAETAVLRFGMWARVGARNHALGWSQVRLETMSNFRKASPGPP